MVQLTNPMTSVLAGMSGMTNWREQDLNLQAHQHMMDAFAKGGLTGTKTRTGTSSPADMVQQLGKLYMNNGMFDKGLKALSDASTMRQKQASIDKDKAQQSLAEVEAQQKHLDQEGKELASVHDQEGLDNFTTRWEHTTGHKAPWEGKPYSPELVQKIQKTFMTAAERLKAESDATKASELKKYRDTMTDLERMRLGLEAERVKNSKSGKAVFPSQSKITLTTDKIRSLHPSFGRIDPNTQDMFATRVAEKADDFMRANKGLDFSTAVNKALMDPQIQKDLNAIADADWQAHWHLGKPQPEQEEPAKDAGLTSANPAPLPPDASQMVDNHWYITYDGKVLQYHKKAEAPPPEKKPVDTFKGTIKRGQ